MKMATDCVDSETVGTRMQIELPDRVAVSSDNYTSYTYHTASASVEMGSFILYFEE